MYQKSQCKLSNKLNIHYQSNVLMASGALTPTCTANSPVGAHWRAIGAATLWLATLSIKHSKQLGQDGSIALCA